jgi:hypothetical protein
MDAPTRNYVILVVIAIVAVVGIAILTGCAGVNTSAFN